MGFLCPAVIDGVTRIVIVSDDGNRTQGRFAQCVLLDVAQLQIAPQELKPQLTMRAQPHQLKPLRIGLAVNQHQIGLDVAVAMVFPFTGQGVVSVLFFERQIIGQCLNDGDEFAGKGGAVNTFDFPLEIPFELPGVLNSSH